MTGINFFLVFGQLLLSLILLKSEVLSDSY